MSRNDATPPATKVVAAKRMADLYRTNASAIARVGHKRLKYGMVDRSASGNTPTIRTDSVTPRHAPGIGTGRSVPMAMPVKKATTPNKAAMPLAMGRPEETKRGRTKQSVSMLMVTPVSRPAVKR